MAASARFVLHADRGAGEPVGAGLRLGLRRWDGQSGGSPCARANGTANFAAARAGYINALIERIKRCINTAR